MLPCSYPRLPLALALLAITTTTAATFAPIAEAWGTKAPRQQHQKLYHPQLYFFDKLFEEEGSLGKGTTVGKIQVALIATNRSKDSIFGDLERKARSTGSSNTHLALLAKEVCLALIRRSDDWTAACSESKWFKADDAGKAESLFNDWANAEAVKFEKVSIGSMFNPWHGNLFQVRCQE
jgi:hypothetical protein